jgi:hypothetical protein
MTDVTHQPKAYTGSQVKRHTAVGHGSLLAVRVERFAG